MGISISIAGIIMGGIAAIVAVVFIILSFVKRKIKRAFVWIAVFVSAIIITITSVYGMIKGIETRMKYPMMELPEESDNAYNSAEQKNARNNFTDTLKLYVNENIKDKVPADFYSDKPLEKTATGSIVVPFLYPFSFHYNPDNFLGNIANDAVDSVYITNISQIAFDENFMIAYLDNTKDEAALKSGRAESEYVLFDLRTHEYLDFTTMQELLGKADKIGYSGPTTMNYLSTYYKGWVNASRQ